MRRAWAVSDWDERSVRVSKRSSNSVVFGSVLLSLGGANRSTR
jgi:hypothetical protein